MLLIEPRLISHRAAVARYLKRWTVTWTAQLWCLLRKFICQNCFSVPEKRLTLQMNTSNLVKGKCMVLKDIVIISLHCALASCGTVYCNWSCLWVCLWVCYHDNSKLHTSILTKLGLPISSWLNVVHPVPPGRGSVAGRKFLAPPYYSQCAVFVSLWALFFHFDCYSIQHVIIQCSFCVLFTWYSL